jgi:hypothetical protein
MLRALTRAPAAYRAAAFNVQAPRAVKLPIRLFSTEVQEEYIGPTVNGLKHGMGRHTTANGAVFEGSFVKGARTGFGTSVNADGFRYEGQWANDKPHGTGKLMFPDGTVYIGGIQNGQMHGTGRLIPANGGPVKYGEWENNVFKVDWVKTIEPPEETTRPAAVADSPAADPNPTQVAPAAEAISTEASKEDSTPAPVTPAATNSNTAAATEAGADSAHNKPATRRKGGKNNAPAAPDARPASVNVSTPAPASKPPTPPQKTTSSTPRAEQTAAPTKTAASEVNHDLSHL